VQLFTHQEATTGSALSPYLSASLFVFVFEDETTGPGIWTSQQAAEAAARSIQRHLVRTELA
jgi:hypothetical protein